MERRVTGAIDLAHAARPKGGQDLVRAEARADGQSQGWQVGLMLARMGASTRVTPDMSLAFIGSAAA